MFRNVVPDGICAGFKRNEYVMGPVIILVMVFIIYLGFGIFTVIFSSTTSRSDYEALKISREFLPLLYYGHGIFFALALPIAVWVTIVYWLSMGIVTQLLPYTTTFTRLGQ